MRDSCFENEGRPSWHGRSRVRYGRDGLTDVKSLHGGIHEENRLPVASHHPDRACDARARVIAASRLRRQQRLQLTAKDLTQLTPPTGKTSSVWLTRFQALSPRPGGPEDIYRIFYVYMESVAGQAPAFFAGTATCQGTTSSCKILQYRGEKPATGTINGTTVTIDVGLNTGFGVPIDGKTLYSVTAFTFGRSNSVDDLYSDVDATEAFDYVLGSDRSN